MILTKDNLLRFVREKKYVTPTHIAEAFDTTTMISSAALSDLTMDKLVAVTHLKIGSTPYYYDPKQKECLVELAEKHFSKYDREVFEKLKENQILNENSLSVQEIVAIQRIKDFAKPLSIEHEGTTLKFWVWYLQNINEVRTQIMDYLTSNKNEQNDPSNKEKEIKPQVEKETPGNSSSQVSQQRFEKVSEATSSSKEDSENNSSPERKNSSNLSSYSHSDSSEGFIENYLHKNYLKIENKQKSEKGIKYNALLSVGSLTILYDIFYFSKKPNETEIIKFYTSSMRPKILFVENPPKKIIKLTQALENCSIVAIK